MSNDTTRRGLLAGALAAGVGGLTVSGASELLESFAPLSGSAWDAADRELSGSVENPYGDATVRYDGYGVPTIEADDEAAAYFAVGYVQAFDRAFQLDLQRRVMRGRLSELVGEATLEDDAFHVAMDFAGAAEATWERVADAPAGPLVEAYAEGVTAAMETEQLPLEFELLGYEPREWTPVDTILMEKQISWDLTGNFGELRRAVIADRLGEDALEELYPERLDHDVPILREGVDGERLEGGDGGGGDGTANSRSGALETDAVDRELASWLSRFESPTGVGSNSWVVSGEHTDGEGPIVAYDPHLTLMTPPLWYEQHVETPETSVRGATFPGVPFVITGANGTGTWSFTNVGADVLDCYEYEMRGDDGSSGADRRLTSTDADEYRYGDEWRAFETEERAIPVADGEDRTFTIKKTVHGPVLEREGQTVGVAWTGHTATRTTEAIYEFERSDGLGDLLESTRKFDLPTQNLVYADADGRTMYYVTGKLPIRRIDGDPVSGNRLFDGSAGEGEWSGFTPFGESSWDGFVPFEEKPHAIDPDVLVTANQRVADDPSHYVGVAYATPYRGARIYERLDERLESGEPADHDFHRELQDDTYDGRAAQLVPDLVDAVANHDGASADLEDAADALADWDYRMERDSSPALVFDRWLESFRREVFEPAFEDADLDESYYPNDWVLATLPADSDWFDGSRAERMVDALEAALAEIDGERWETYGDRNTTGPIEHPFGVEAPFLDYDDRPADGSAATVKNYRVDSAVGSSWRMVVEPGGDATAILPGGNSGDYFSEHYDDQFEAWLDGEQKPMDRSVDDGDPDVVFEAANVEGSQ
ncbi:penicillin amidase [Halobiforma haloterrestris]|uniref:Penicillin amidase n=1 Tax=Natronobacterium haloterrestre TaxID=148448 RepID=A0A1I1G3N3_NATHA|nr:penicillin acylase family protein [Halobiforma haloterrestris]SFC06459.1 penicillin amidase [Halobiforma haloterrestris]